MATSKLHIGQVLLRHREALFGNPQEKKYKSNLMRGRNKLNWNSKNKLRLLKKVFLNPSLLLAERNLS